MLETCIGAATLAGAARRCAVGLQHGDHVLECGVIGMVQGAGHVVVADLDSELFGAGA